MCDKKKKNKKKKTKKLSQFLKSHISGTREAISLTFGMWSAAVGGNVHSKNRLVSSRKHRATEVRKLRFLSSCQYTHGCYAPASWAARHTTVCLDHHQHNYNGAGQQYMLIKMVEKARQVYWMFCKATALLSKLKALLASISKKPSGVLISENLSHGMDGSLNTRGLTSTKLERTSSTLNIRSNNR